MQIKKKNAASHATAARTKTGGLMQAAVAEAKARQKAAQAARKSSGAKAAGGAKAPAAAKHAGKGR